MKNFVRALPFAVCAIALIALFDVFDFSVQLSLATIVVFYSLSYLPEQTYNELFGFGLPIRFLLPIAPFMILAYHFMLLAT